MARLVKKEQIKTCDRCAYGKLEPVKETRQFPVAGQWYEIDLCDKHVAMFDRELDAWKMLATEIDPPAHLRVRSAHWIAERQRETEQLRQTARETEQRAQADIFAQRRAAELAAEEERDRQRLTALLADKERQVRLSVPGALNYRLTDHARQRLTERGFSLEAVFNTVTHPAQILEQPWRSPTICVHIRGDCRVVVDTANGGILTVIAREKELETRESFEAQRARQGTDTTEHYHSEEKAAL